MSGFTDLSSFFTRIPVALYRSTKEGSIISANPALATLLGYDSVEDLKESLANVETVYVDPTERVRWIEQIALAGVINDFDVELRRRDGSTVWVRDSARAVKDDSGAILHFEGSLIDVTDKVKAQRDKDEFIATVSHELRNPIAVILGLGEELSCNYDSFTDLERQEMANLIALQAEDVGWLIEDLLVAYRHDISQVAIAPHDFDVVKEVERVLDVIDTPISVLVGDESTVVFADPRRTRQILRNLVSNAGRYGGNEVEVHVIKSGDRIEVQVRDSGQPLSDVDIERLFKPFERGSAANHPKSVGLGLNVARRLARLMDGDLVYRRENRWTCFVLSLPSA